jgi:hypothetical protein
VLVCGGLCDGQSAEQPEDRLTAMMDFVEAFTEVTQGDTSAPTPFFDV